MAFPGLLVVIANRETMLHCWPEFAWWDLRHKIKSAFVIEPVNVCGHLRQKQQVLGIPKG